jgi:hypothetical protein
LTALHVSSDILAHHHDHPNCMYSFWFYFHVSLPAAGSRQRHMKIIPETVYTVWMFLMMSECIARNMKSSQGAINYPTQLHLVGHFRKPPSWIVLVSKFLYNGANIITKYQIVFLREKSSEFILTIAKETCFNIWVGGEYSILLVWNLRIQFKSRIRSLRFPCVNEWVSDEEQRT